MLTKGEKLAINIVLCAVMGGLTAAIVTGLWPKDWPIALAYVLAAVLAIVIGLVAPAFVNDFLWGKNDEDNSGRTEKE